MTTTQTIFGTYQIERRFYDVEDIPLVCYRLRQVESTEVKSKRDGTIEYLEVPAAFDLEASSFYYDKGKKGACMYIWTIGICGMVIAGRTWGQFVTAIESICFNLRLSLSRRLIVWIHNADYDFGFMRKWLEWEKVFSIAERKPLYMITKEGIEFRCSYKQSGYSLEYLGNHLRKYKVEKMVGDLDYQIVRHSLTPLNSKEMGYILNDSKVLMAYIQEQIEEEGSITRIPLTKTGYVRRFVKEQCFGNTKESKQAYHNKMAKLRIKPVEYKMLKDGFQGGFTHASPFFVDKIVENVDSLDYTSSYPARLIEYKYPMGPGIFRTVKTEKDFNHFRKKYCCLFEIEFYDLEATFIFDYYLSSSRCKCEGETLFNGRISSASYVRTTITEQDYEIIERTYKWKKKKIGKFITYEKDYLPEEFIRAVLYLYKRKTELKGLSGKDENGIDYEVEYARIKEMLNSCYGMCVTDIAKILVYYEGNRWESELNQEEKENLVKDKIEDLLSRYNKSWSRFLFYPWGVWCTAYARKSLWAGIIACGPDYIYSDTDSIKLRNLSTRLEWFNRFNAGVLKRLKTTCDHYNIPYDMIIPKNAKGVEKPLGVWDFDGAYSKFKTIGAKRYIVQYSNNPKNGDDCGKIKLTTAGLDKKKGVEFLRLKYGESGIFDGYTNNLNIPGEYTGKLTHTYIDHTLIIPLKDYMGIEYEINERSYIHMEPAPYSLQFTSQFIEFYKTLQGLLFEI